MTQPSVKVKEAEVTEVKSRDSSVTDVKTATLVSLVMVSTANSGILLKFTRVVYLL